MPERAADLSLAADVMSEIARVLRQELGIQKEITQELELQRDLALDSMSLMTLIVALEDRFRVVLKEEDAPGILTVGDLITYVARRAGESC